jgi:hypothetical protein
MIPIILVGTAYLLSKTMEEQNLDIKYEEGGGTKSIDYVTNQLEKNINSDKIKIDEPLTEFKGFLKKYKIGDTIDSDYLPESQAEPPKGIYTLMVVPISTTDVFLGGMATRSAFSYDDYDGWQTRNLDMIKEGFDTNDREPIIAIRVKDGLLRLVDGHHRITIANELGRKYILAFVKDESEGDDCGWFKKSYKEISEAYHKAKKDGNNTEFVKSIEQALKDRICYH